MMEILPAFPRFVLARVLEALNDTPVVLIHGARQTGKTTLARSIGDARGYAYVTLDNGPTFEAARTDPSGFVDHLPSRVIVDEIGRVPELFASLKLAVDEDRSPGRFILTGSTNVLLSPKLSESLAGRMEVLRLRPLSQAEIEGTDTELLDRLFECDLIIDRNRGRSADLLDRIVRGGYPPVLQRASEQRRQRWYSEYIDALLAKDVREIGEIRELEVLPRLLRLIAARTACLLNISELTSTLQVSRPTVDRYVGMLEALFLIERLPAWSPNRSKRLVKSPKLHLCDTGLACALLGADATSLVAEETLRGRLVETFVHQELRRNAAWNQRRLAFHHFRSRDRAEVDIVIERPDGVIVGVEVKSSGTVIARDFTGLQALKAIAGNRMRCGVVFYNGDSVLPFGEGLYAVPVGRLWGR